MMHCRAISGWPQVRVLLAWGKMARYSGNMCILGFMSTSTTRPIIWMWSMIEVAAPSIIHQFKCRHELLHCHCTSGKNLANGCINHGDHEFCFLLVYVLINSLVHFNVATWCHCVARTRYCNVPNDPWRIFYEARGEPIWVNMCQWRNWSSGRESLRRRPLSMDTTVHRAFIWGVHFALHWRRVQGDVGQQRKQRMICQGLLCGFGLLNETRKSITCRIIRL